MKPGAWVRWGLAVCLSAATVAGQQANEVEALRKQLEQLKNDFEKTITEQRRTIDALQKQLDALQPSRVAATNPPATAVASTPAATSPGLLSPGWSPGQPITVARAGAAYMNVSFDALLDFGWSTDREP